MKSISFGLCPFPSPDFHSGSKEKNPVKRAIEVTACNQTRRLTTCLVDDVYEQNVKVDVGILKIEKDNPSKTIPNVGFTLWEINEELPQPSGEPSLKNADDSGKVFTTGTDGTVSMQDLTQGYYKLKETGVPMGYVVNGSDTTYFRVNGNGSVEQLIVVDGTGEYAGQKVWQPTDTSGNFAFAANSKQFTISNEPGKPLPMTGGSGAEPYTLLGVACILAAACLMIGNMRRRRRA